MSKWAKLLARLYNLDKNLRFEDLEKILLAYGYVKSETNGGSSHVTFRKTGCAPITIPRHSPIKVAYVKMLRDIVMLEDSLQ